MKSHRPVPIRIELHDIVVVLAAICTMVLAVFVAKTLESYWAVMVAFGLFCFIISYVYWMYWRYR